MALPAEIFVSTRPAQLRQGDWMSDQSFLDALRASWTRQYADYVGDAEAAVYVEQLEKQGRLFDHHRPLTLHAWQGDSIVGVTALRPLNGIDLITMLEVRTEYRGQGIGHQLLSALCCRRERLMAHVSIHQPRVRTFYTRLGFHVLNREHVRHGAHRLEFDVVAWQP